MNPVTGYLPVWLISAQHTEYIDILSKHYNVEYFDFDELAPLATIIPPYKYISAKKSGSIVYAYAFPFPSLRSHIWSFVSQLNRHFTLSLVKLS
jgi:hypothetical protein